MAEVMATASPEKHRKAKMSAMKNVQEQLNLEDSADSDPDLGPAAKKRRISPTKSPRKRSIAYSPQNDPVKEVIIGMKDILDENANTVPSVDTTDIIKQEKDFRGDEDSDYQIDEDEEDEVEDEDSQDSQQDSRDSQASNSGPSVSFAEPEKLSKKDGVKCSECGFMSPNKGELQKHMRKHTPDKPYGCPIPGCSFRTRYPNNIRHHLPSHLDDRPFPCDECELKFKRKSQLTTHMLIHTQVKNFACDLCEAKFKRRWELKMHKLSHSDKKYFKCETCGHETKTLSDLNKHKYKHREERDFICAICSKAYKDNRALRKHMSYSHGDNPPVECDLCQKQFKNKIYLKKHQLLHEGHYPFECEMCGMKFSSMGNKRSHMVVHSGEGRPYKCPVCPYAGKSELDVRAHIGVMHRKDRIYRCDICSIGFAKEQGLRQHYTTLKHKTNLEKLMEYKGDENTEVIVKLERDTEEPPVPPESSVRQVSVALLNNEEVTVKIEREDEDEAYERDLQREDHQGAQGSDTFAPVVARVEGGMVVVEGPKAVQNDVINRVVKKITQQRDKQVNEYGGTPAHTASASPASGDTASANEKPAKKGKNRKSANPSRRVVSPVQPIESDIIEPVIAPPVALTNTTTEDLDTEVTAVAPSEKDDVNNNPTTIKPIGTLTLQSDGPVNIKTEPMGGWPAQVGVTTADGTEKQQPPIIVSIKSEPAW